MDQGGEGAAAKAVAVVVINYNGKDMLLECLRSVELATYRPLHIVVVDNGSTDGSVHAVQNLHPGVQIVRKGYNAGVSGGRNAGVRWVMDRLHTEYVVFLDNDTQVEPDAVGELVAAANRDPRIGLVTPKAFRRKGDRELLSAGGLHFNPYTGVLRDVATGEVDSGQYDVARDVQACPGFAFLVRQVVFRDVGFFDETFNPYGWEDADLSLRAARAGIRIVYAPKAVVYHAGGRVGRGIVDLYEKHKARNMFYFVRRHTTLVQRLCFLCILPVRALGRVTKEIATGNGRVVLTWFGLTRRKS